MPAIRGFAARNRGALVAAGLLVLALAVYLPYALKGGWYYDDWKDYALFQHAGSSWLSQFEACTASIPGGRNLSCIYHVTEYHLLTHHKAAYHLVAIIFLVAMATMAYAILVRCRLPWYWAALVAALLIVFPASDSTRLWPTGAIGQYVLVLELGGVLITLAALRRPWERWTTKVLHLVSALLFLLAMTTYEITVPLVALNGILYWAAYRNRAAIKRGLLDFGLAICFLIYRAAISPPKEEEGFTVHRTISENIHRGWDLIVDAWNVWHQVLIPGTLGTVAVVAVLVLGLTATVLDAEARRRLKPWWYFLGGAVIVALGATLVFQTANVLYVPVVGSLFNRVVLPAAIPYICAFVALLGIAAELINRFVKVRWVAPAAVAVVLAISCVHQLRISSDHKREFENSWTEQEAALPLYDHAVEGLPEESRFLSFGIPVWEPEYVPIFAASWDLSGALQYTTPLNPPFVEPFGIYMKCGATAVVSGEEEELVTPYRTPGQPLYFIATEDGGIAKKIRNQADCEAAVAQFGIPPNFVGEPKTYP